MRTIRFRGFNKKRKEWLYGYYLKNRGVHFVCSDEFAPKDRTWEDYEVDPKSVGQDTALTDYDGKEVFEGDIVKYNGEFFKVIYHKGYGCFLLVRGEEEVDVILSGVAHVVGNIYENPEMLQDDES